MRFLPFLCVSLLAWSAYGDEMHFNFGDYDIGSTPTNFDSVVGGTGTSGVWKIISTETVSAFSALSTNGPTMILALTFFGLRTRDHRQAAALSLMAQSIGYFIAALGPIIFGLLHDVSHGWTLPLLAMAGSLIVQAAAGFGAGRNTQIGDGP